MEFPCFYIKLRPEWFATVIGHLAGRKAQMEANRGSGRRKREPGRKLAIRPREIRTKNFAVMSGRSASAFLLHRPRGINAGIFLPGLLTQTAAEPARALPKRGRRPLYLKEVQRSVPLTLAVEATTNPTMSPYSPKASAKMRMRIMPTNSRGCCAFARTPASPTIPIASPAARDDMPTVSPAPRCAYPEY